MMFTAKLTTLLQTFFEFMLNSEVVSTSIKGPDNKIFEGKIMVRTKLTNLFQIFCEIMLHSEVIFKSIKGPDDIDGILLCAIF